MIETIITSPTTNIVLTLLLLFQWYKQHAKEQSVKNNLFSVRRMVIRIEAISDISVLKEKAADLIDAIDATLATLEARLPFVERVREVVSSIRRRFGNDSKKAIEKLPYEAEQA